jgi:large subunit ribosomal protein L1
MGKVSFGPEKLLQNIASFFEVIQRLKPATSKGAYFRGISISTTMGPGVKIDPGQVRELTT